MLISDPEDTRDDRCSNGKIGSEIAPYIQNTVQIAASEYLDVSYHTHSAITPVRWCDDTHPATKGAQGVEAAGLTNHRLQTRATRRKAPIKALVILRTLPLVFRSTCSWYE